MADQVTSLAIQAAQVANLVAYQVAWFSRGVSQEVYKIIEDEMETEIN